MSTKTEIIVRGFEKCRTSVRIDGLRDDLININRLQNYRVCPDPTDSGDSGDNLIDMDSSDDDLIAQYFFIVMPSVTLLTSMLLAHFHSCDWDSFGH